jgi:two-component system, LytTR family, response regulator
MYKAILIDDEKLALERLTRLLNPFRDKIKIIYQTTNSKDAIARINDLQPDVIFLDIQMPVYNGFEILQRLKKLPVVIFVTAYEKYSLKAFETNSIDYLLKPVDPKRLKKAIDKLEILIGNKSEEEIKLKELMKFMNRKMMKRLKVDLHNKTLLIRTEDIFYFKANEKYVDVHTFEKKYLLNKTLQSLEEEYSRSNFIRIHRSYLVNTDKIDSIVKTKTGDCKVVLTDLVKSEIPVSRQMKLKLEEFVA